MDVLKVLSKLKHDLLVAETQQKEEENLTKNQPPESPPNTPDNAEKKNETDQQILERITALENKNPKLEISIATLKRENDEIKNKLTHLDSKLIDMLSLYEVVANQVNPFVGVSKVTSASIEKLEEMGQDVEKLEDKVSSMEHDLKIILGEVDVNDIVRNVLVEGEYEQ
jgi:flagellar protein FlaC